MSRVLFTIILVLELCFFGAIIFTQRLVDGHDGFEYFCLQYFFLNNLVNTGEIPQWLPFLTQGTIVNWLFAVQGSILQNSLVFFSKLFGNANFLSVFYFSIFFDVVILLTGIWLLARRFFVSSLTVFFVSVTVIGSCVWMTQPWYNFHFYYAIPLILYFGHNFLETGQWRYSFLAVNLLVVQNFGNLPYFFPVVTFVVFSYFVLYLLINRDVTFPQLKKLQFGLPSTFTFVGLGFSFFFAYFLLKIGTDPLINYNFGRDLNMTTNVDGFLAYGSNLDLRKWYELIIGVSPALDYTLFIGIMPPLFIAFGVRAFVRKENIHFLFVTLLLLLLSAGGFFAQILYYIWPMMKYYRHLGLVVPIVKVFFCFLAGFGFERLCIENKLSLRLPRERFSLIGILLLSFSLITLLIYLIGYPLEAKNFIGSLVTQGFFGMAEDGTHYIYRPGIPIFPLVFTGTFISEQLTRTLVFLILALAVFLGAAAVKKKTHYSCCIVALLVLQTADVYSYKFQEMALRTVPLSETLRESMRFQELPFKFRRTINAFSDSKRSEMLMLFEHSGGQMYWISNLLTFSDELGGSFRVDHWLRPFDNFMRAYWGQPMDDLSQRPKGLVPYQRLDFPVEHIAARKFSGLDEDKIQFFSSATCMDDDKKVADTITQKSFAGDMLFLSPCGAKDSLERILSRTIPKNLSVNDRLKLPYTVTRFDANNLEVSVDIPQKKEAWLFYSDVWHPFWKARINGVPAELFKANLAYKAVHLQSGKNNVHFYFNSPLLSALFAFFSLNSLFWVGMIAVLTIKLILPSSAHAGSAKT